ncbi:MAG: GNAT family N-acetyltransferase [Leptolyngbyaceae cyanobacterium]
MTAIHYRPATPEDWDTIAQHFHDLWRDNGVPETGIRPDWQALTLDFIQTATATLDYQAFVAEVQGEIVGSVGGQRFAGLYPNALMPEQRCYGYLWNVYVVATYRRQGMGRALTQRAVAYLKSLGCTRIILHASPFGQPLYEQMGFQPSNEMRLDL